jgi:hypothetical protein
VCLTSTDTPLSGTHTLTQHRHRSAADRIPSLLLTFPCRSLRCQQYIISKWNRRLRKTDLSSVYQARHEPGTMPPTPAPPAVLDLYHNIFPHNKLKTFPVVSLSVRNRLAAQPLLQRILHTAFNYDQDIGWKTREARFHYRQGHWILSSPQKPVANPACSCSGSLGLFPRR